MIHPSRTSFWTKSELGLHCTQPGILERALKAGMPCRQVRHICIALAGSPSTPGAGVAHESHLPSQQGLGAF